jgi:hypothetical protein
VTDHAGGDPGSESRCGWCSSVVPSDATTCPSCGAALKEPAADEEPTIPGVTSIDPTTPTRRPIARPNRLVRLIAGDLDEPLPAAPLRPDGPTAVSGSDMLGGPSPASVAPPSAEVRREMARLELEAIKAELEARAAAAEVPAEAEGDAPA